MAVRQKLPSGPLEKEVDNETKFKGMEKERTDALEMEKEENEAKEKGAENEAEVTRDIRFKYPSSYIGIVGSMG